MATGDQDDFLNRLLTVIPPWFGDPTTDDVLLGLLNGYAEMGSEIYNQYSYTKLQTRIKTATDSFLDLISTDFFGVNLPRATGESDSSYQARILYTLLAQKATRVGMYTALLNITGRAPRIIEPWRAYDTGAWSCPTWGYSKAGSWSTYPLAYQAFIDVYLPNQSTLPGVTGYNDSPGGYGVGYISYGTQSQLGNQLADQQVLDTINATKVYGTRIWVRFNS